MFEYIEPFLQFGAISAFRLYFKNISFVRIIIISLDGGLVKLQENDVGPPQDLELE